MPNKSEIRPGSPSEEELHKDPDSAAHTEAEENEEMAAKHWVEERYDFDFSNVPEEQWKQYVDSHHKIWATYKDRKLGSDRHGRGFEDKIREHPELTFEELVGKDRDEKYGHTNNFWRLFYPGYIDGVREAIKEGKVVKGRLVIWQQEGHLMPAFQKVGYRRIKRLHEALADYVRLSDYFKELQGDNPMSLGYSSRQIFSDPERFSKIAPKDKEKYFEAELEMTNALRSLSLALMDEGVGFYEMAG